MPATWQGVRRGKPRHLQSVCECPGLPAGHSGAVSITARRTGREADDTGEGTHRASNVSHGNNRNLSKYSKLWVCTFSRSGLFGTCGIIHKSGRSKQRPSFFKHFFGTLEKLVSAICCCVTNVPQRSGFKQQLCSISSLFCGMHGLGQVVLGKLVTQAGAAVT